MEEKNKLKNFKSLEELTREGWEYTGIRFSYLQIYKNGEKRILYDNNNQSIYAEYVMKDNREL